MSVEDDNFLTEGWGCVIIFSLRVFTFWFDTEKALFQVILGLLCLSSSITMYKSVYVHVVHDLELLRYVLRCAIKQQL